MRTLLPFFLFLLVILLGGINPLLAQWVQTGPYGGDVRAIIMSGKTVFAGTYGAGVFSSSDSTGNWIKANNGLTTYIINSLLRVGTNLFAGTQGGGVFRSTNNGASWNVFNSGLTSLYIRGGLVAIDSNIFAGTEQGVFLSTNNGVNWIPVNTGLNNLWVNCLAVDGAVLYVGYPGGISYTTNNGTNWTKIVQATDITALFASGNQIFFGLLPGGGIYIYEDGNTLRNVNKGLDLTQGGRYPIISAITNNGTNIFAATSVGVYRWSPSDTSWTLVLSGNTNCLAGSNTNFLVGTTSGILRSTNNGTSWNSVNTGMANLSAVAIGVIGTTALVMTTGGVFRSTDNGMNWSIADSRLSFSQIGNTPSGAIATYGTLAYAASNGSLYRSDDAGVNWTVMGLNLNSSYIYVAALAIMGKRLFAGIGSYNNNYGVVFSDDSGRNWSTSGLGNQDVRSLMAKGANIFAGTNGIFYSSDNGNNWSAIIDSSLNNAMVWAFAYNGTNMFAGTDGNGILCSKDNGTTWNAVNTGIANTSIDLINTVVFAFSIVGSNIFTGTGAGAHGGGTQGYGIFLSTNNGGSWNAVNTGLPASTEIWSLAVSGSYLLAGTSSHGVWRRPITDMLTNVQDDPIQRPSQYNLEQNYPNPFNPTTTISFSLPSKSFVTLRIFDILGREVAIIVSEEMSAGNYSHQWNAATMSSGIYFYCLKAGSFTETKKLILIR
jgi:hypothetical protein